MIDNEIKEIAKRLEDVLNKISVDGANSQYSFELSCGSLNDYNHVNIRESEEYRDIFTKLKEMDSPVLYWFEITSDIDNQTVRNAIEGYANQEDSKATPALKKHFDPMSKCLYVGKVKKGVWGRMIQHLGFYKQPRTQGLQLFYWAKQIHLELKAHIYEFDQSAENLVSVLEVELANKLNPIVGKH